MGDGITRRDALKRLFLGAGVLAAGGPGAGRLLADERPALPPEAPGPYRGPNVILVRFGGGVRRRETIDPEHTYCPWFLKELAPRGTLFRNMELAQLEGVETSHGQGTLYLVTGKYDRFQDVGGKVFGARFEAKVPTVFEYLRRRHAIPEHETLIVNGEDRTDEEFYSFSNHHLFGARFRCDVLSLYRFKVHRLRRELERNGLPEKEREAKRRDYEKLRALDHRLGGDAGQSPEIEAFWDRWTDFYGSSGLVNPRGDRLLTELALRAMAELRPRLLLVNYNDPDYVHWGYPAHYTLGIGVIDEGIRRLVTAAEADPHYRGNTVFVVVPDCGRDTNRFLEVPFQHHFGTRSAHEIFALLVGPGIARGQVVDRLVQQTDVAPTIGRIMGFETPYAEGRPLAEALL